MALVTLLARQRGQPQQHLDGHRRAAGHRVVIEVARADDETLVVGAGIEEAADTLVPEQAQHVVGELLWRSVP